VRRLTAISLVLLAACGTHTPSPTTTTAPTSAATTGQTTGATTGPTTAPSSPAGVTSPGAGGTAAACAALDRLFFAFHAAVPEFRQIATEARHMIDVSTTIGDQGEATLVATIGTDALNAAKAFLADDLEKGSRLENRAVQTMPPARVALGCS